MVPFEIDGIALRRRHARPPLHGAATSSRSAASTIMCPRLSGRRSCSTPTAARRSSCRRPQSRLRARAGAGRGRGAAGGSRRPRRMAGRAGGQLRSGLPGHPARGGPRHHPRQPEVLRAARSRHGRAHQPLRPRRQYRGEGRRREDRRPATSASCARASPTPGISGEPTSATCPITRRPKSPASRWTSAWRS